MKGKIIALLCGSVVYGENGGDDDINACEKIENVSEEKGSDKAEKTETSKTDVTHADDLPAENTVKPENTSISAEKPDEKKGENTGKNEASEKNTVTDEKNSANNENIFSEKAGVTSTDVEVTEKAEQSALSASIKCLNDGQDIYFGDKVTLKATVKGAEKKVTIVWEYRETAKSDWKALGVKGEKYSFTVTEQNAAYEYRVVVTEG